jgi:protoporphyrinogen oxidase
MKVVILGGGAAGMTAAWELARGGAEVTVIEREPRLGGLCATHERDGWRFDLGGHRFISRSGELVDRVRGLLGEELLERTRKSVILHGGRRFRYPLDALDLAANLRSGEAMHAVASWARARVADRLHPRPARSFEDWVTARFGAHLYARFFGPYTEKLWGLPPSELSADWAAERISLLDLGDALLRLLYLRRARRPRTYARGYFYPRLGIGQIFEHMGKELARLSARTILDAEATGFLRDRGGRIRAVRYRAAGREDALPADFVISTVSLPLVAGFLQPRSPRVARHARALRYRAVRFLNLMLDREQISPNTWMYVSDPRFLATRIQEPKHRSPEMAPPGCTSLMLEIPCAIGDAVWRAGDPELARRCLEDLSALGVDGVASSLRGAFSTFVAEGYPIYSLGYAEHQRALTDVVSEVPNLISCGRQGTFRYIFMDIAMEMGLAAARQVLAGRPRPRAFLAFRSDRQLIETQSLTA